MTPVHTGGSRFAAASVSFCLLLLGFSTVPTRANIVIPVLPTNGGGPLGPCQGCNQSQTSGTATGGSASNNSDGTGSQLDITYDTPSDNTMYSGTLMTQVVNPDGSVTVNIFPISDFANGSSGYASAFNSSVIPLGGAASITVNESNASGASFSAGWTIRNFHP
jgi:hypothetical protein